MNPGRWKRHEREVAALLGGMRLPNAGRSQADVITRNLAVQVKTRTHLPVWLLRALDQAERDCDADRIPVVVLCVASQGRKTRRLLLADLDRLRAD
jgi:hypothetical protein